RRPLPSPSWPMRPSTAAQPTCPAPRALVAQPSLAKSAMRDPINGSWHRSLGIGGLLGSSAPWFRTSLLLLLSGCTNGQPAGPGTLVFLIETMPANLDPRIGTDAQSQRLHSLLFSGLLERDVEMNLRGDLAERWESPDPLTFIFHLRRGVRFHNGLPLTAADVKFSYDSILSGQIHTPKRGTFRMLAAVDAPDPATVVFHLREPYASFLWNLARPAVGIVPAGSGADLA